MSTDHAASDTSAVLERQLWKYACSFVGGIVKLVAGLVLSLYFYPEDLLFRNYRFAVQRLPVCRSVN
ncbi:MAG: hypothetical protein BJ554DRAFT_6060 [Olpidium bornovanus]|uniref:Uncharacterized protein n=1 Tax=Olpidium bornovanus TaxID=278681 RepID=A0A8H7ZYI6_9FUNG|nr:MAG: hypothetical protein BJ554DRAFT_6060 [Olpidium bornovanus]